MKANQMSRTRPTEYALQEPGSARAKFVGCVCHGDWMAPGADPELISLACSIHTQRVRLGHYIRMVGTTSADNVYLDGYIEDWSKT